MKNHNLAMCQLEKPLRLVKDNRFSKNVSLMVCRDCFEVQVHDLWPAKTWTITVQVVNDGNGSELCEEGR